MRVDPKQLEPKRYVMVDPEQTDLEQYATGLDEDPPEGVFPYGVVTTDGRILWGVVSRSSLPMLLDRIDSGGCYQFWALDGSEPPEYLFEAGQDNGGGDESRGWRDAYTAKFGEGEEQ